jgi:HEAT repeat protein
MSWWGQLLESRRLRPQTSAPGDGDDRASLALDDLTRAWFEAMFSMGERAAEREAEELARLRADPVRALAGLTAAYDQAAESDYAFRWALVYGVGQLKTAAGLPFLERILHDEIPPEQSDDVHHLSTVAEETSLRFQAIHGIAALASDSDSRAVAALLDQLTHRNYGVRVMAAQALLALPGRPVSKEDLRKRLPSEEADRVLEIRQTSVERIAPPVEPGARPSVPRPPGGESGSEFDGVERRPPRIGG